MMELFEQGWLDALPCLVTSIELVAERLDDVVGSDTDVCRTILHHLENRIEYTDNGAEWFVLAAIEAALTVEVAKQLISAVDQMNHDLRHWKLAFSQSYRGKMKVDLLPNARPSSLSVSCRANLRWNMIEHFKPFLQRCVSLDLEVDPATATIFAFAAVRDDARPPNRGEETRSGRCP